MKIQLPCNSVWFGIETGFHQKKQRRLAKAGNWSLDSKEVKQAREWKLKSKGCIVSGILTIIIIIIMRNINHYYHHYYEEYYLLLLLLSLLWGILTIIIIIIMNINHNILSANKWKRENGIGNCGFNSELGEL